MSEQETFIEYPCDFPIKAMGPASDEFEALVVTLARKHAPDLSENAVKSRPSKGGKYMSVTITVHATSREQLDNIYRELTACEQILMAL